MPGTERARPAAATPRTSARRVSELPNCATSRSPVPFVGVPFTVTSLPHRPRRGAYQRSAGPPLPTSRPSAPVPVAGAARASRPRLNVQAMGNVPDAAQAVGPSICLSGTRRREPIGTGDGPPRSETSWSPRRSGTVTRAETSSSTEPTSTKATRIGSPSATVAWLAPAPPASDPTRTKTASSPTNPGFATSRLPARADHRHAFFPTPGRRRSPERPPRPPAGPPPSTAPAPRRSKGNGCRPAAPA